MQVKRNQNAKQSKFKHAITAPVRGLNKLTNTPYKRAKLGTALQAIDLGITGTAWGFGIPIPPPITATKAAIDLGKSSMDLIKSRREQKLKYSQAAKKRTSTMRLHKQGKHIIYDQHIVKYNRSKHGV